MVSFLTKWANTIIGIMQKKEVRRLTREKDILRRRSTLRKKKAWDLGNSSMKFENEK